MPCFGELHCGGMNPAADECSACLIRLLRFTSGPLLHFCWLHSLTFSIFSSPHFSPHCLCQYLLSLTFLAFSVIFFFCICLADFLESLLLSTSNLNAFISSFFSSLHFSLAPLTPALWLTEYPDKLSLPEARLGAIKYVSACQPAGAMH